MEITVDGVYFGSSEHYLCSSATISRLSIKLSLSSGNGNGNNKSLLIMKKHIIDLKAPQQCPTPFICLKLKDTICQQIRELLELDKVGVNFNSRSTDEREVWMIFFYHFNNFDVPKFLASHYILKKNFLSHEEQKDFLRRLTSNARMMLWFLGHGILALRQQEGAVMPQVCAQTMAMILHLEDRIIAKKLLSYFVDVEAGMAVQGKELKVKYKSEALSPWELKEIITSYKSCLVCGSCGGEALLKCGHCWVTRYCTRDCQVKDFKRHKGECNKLGAERKIKDMQGSLVIVHQLQGVVEQLKNWERRVPFEVWQKKFTDLLNKTARESIRNEVGIDLVINGVTRFMNI